MAELQFSTSGIAYAFAGIKPLCIINNNEGLFACSATCPHAGANLSKGFLDVKCNIVCPHHGYRFSIKNGYNTSGEGYHLKTYKIEEREDGVYCLI